MEINNSVLLIFWGSFLTFAGTWSVESYKNHREKKEKERNFKLLAKQELQIVIKTFDTLKTTLDHRNYYEYNILDRLNSSRFTLEGYRRDAIYLSSQNLQERFIDLVSSVGVYHANIKSLQDIFWAQQKKLRNEQESGTGNREEKTDVGARESVFESEENLNRYFNESKLQYLIEHAEIKRQMGEMIKEFEK